jgi:hypothetical protein
MQYAAISTDLSRDLASDATNLSLGVRLEDALRLAERCATARQSLAAKGVFEELDVAATDLWNLATNLARDGPEEKSMAVRVLRGTYYPTVSPPLMSNKAKQKVRLLALYLIECAQGAPGANYHNTIRLLKVSLKTARQCVG